jgi:branched-chain amino acid transport system ATP-binding protein
MLEVKDLSVSYGKHIALEDASVRVDKGEIVVILGANGAGKSSLLKAISGVSEGRVSGTVTMDGIDISGRPANRIVEEGIALVPEGRGVFADLNVQENLTLGAYGRRARDEEAANLEQVLTLFPKLRERRRQIVRTMSGGEQQMVAIGRAMMSNPQILTLDEPSLGLSPLLCKDLFQSLKTVRAAGIGILLVEQNAKQSLAIADRGYLLENGRIVHEDRAEKLMTDPAVQKAYLGGGGGHAAPAPTPRAAAPVADSAPADLPPGVTIRAKPQRSIPASEVLGLDLDAIIAGAAARSRPPAPAARPASLAPGQTRAAIAARSDRLSAALAEIEAAARKPRARVPLAPLPPLRPVGARPAPPDPHPAAAPDAATATPAPAPQPGGRITVYRRRPGSDHFDRTEV